MGRFLYDVILLYYMKFSKQDLSKGLRLPKVDNNNLAYLCGVFAGDGSLNFRASRSEYFLKCVGNPKDEKGFYKKQIGPRFKNLFGFMPKLKLYDRNTTYGFTVYSRALVLYLTRNIELPLGVKYACLKIPPPFLQQQRLLVSFIRGLFDTDGCISFKKKYRSIPYYPVISFSSKSSSFVKEVSTILTKWGFNLFDYYNYKRKGPRTKEGFTCISGVEMNGNDNLILWQKRIGFFSSKHNKKINKYWKK